MQDVGRRRGGSRRGAERVPGQAGQCGRLDALAAHVADRDAPSILARQEHVVEVAADQVGGAGRPVPSRDRDAVGRIEVLRQQPELQRFGDVALLVVEALVVGGQSHGGVAPLEQPSRQDREPLPPTLRRAQRSTTGWRTDHR